MANQLIQKLLDAEQEADSIVRRAKEGWVVKLKEAQASAEKDIEKFRASEEEKFRKEYAEKHGKDNLHVDLDEQTKRELELVKAQFKKNRDAAVAVLISGAVKVNLNLSEAEQRQIKLRFGADPSAA